MAGRSRTLGALERALGDDPEPVVLALAGGIGPTDVLRHLDDDERPVGLVGSWAGGGALVASAPLVVADPGDDPFELLDALPHLRPLGDAVCAGWFGNLGYRLGRRLERLPPEPRRPRPAPDWDLAFYDHLLRFDATTRTWWFEALRTPGRAVALESRLAHLARIVAGAVGPRRSFTCGPFHPVPGRNEHLAAVERCVTLIRAGDLFQANLCVRVEAAFSGSPLELFATAVERLEPARAAYVSRPGGAVCSLSPELFLERRGATVASAPIKGTRPRTGGHADHGQRRELEASVKDRAENIMIVDLVRNDLGRVATPGSVRAPGLVQVEAHPGVWHLVSRVEALLGPATGTGTVLRAAFPPGSVTGAPKVAAMRVAAELEATAREAYTGAVGYAGVLGAAAEWNVAIRTFEVDGDAVWIGVGGGITAASAPDEEWAECCTKVRPLLGAVGSHLEGDACAPDAPDGGLFETLLVEGGRVLELDGHLSRLRRSAALLHGVELATDLAQRAHEVAAASWRPRRMRLRWAPGGAEGVEIELTDLPRPVADSIGLTLVPVAAPPTSSHKLADRRALERCEWEAAARSPGAEPLLVDPSGRVLETSRGNVFLVLDDELVTPPLDGRVLPGVTRRLVLDVAQALGIPVATRPVELDELAAAASAFSTGSLRGTSWWRELVGVRRWERADPVYLELARAVAACRRRTHAAHPGALPHRGTPPLPGGVGRGAVTVVVIDNYDSFTHNLVQQLRSAGCTTVVHRNDAVDVAQLTAECCDGLVVSPGPRTPREAGISIAAVTALGPDVPVLGVCLGHQAIAVAFGGRLRRAPEPVHGRASTIHHDGVGLYAGAGGPFPAGRYHALEVDPASLPTELVPTAWSDDGVLMGLRHRSLPIEGVQFHPESVLTEGGGRLVDAFVRLCRARAGR